MNRVRAAGLLVFLAVVPAFAEDSQHEDRLDTALSACLNSPDGQTTAGTEMLYEGWDKALTTNTGL